MQAVGDCVTYTKQTAEAISGADVGFIDDCQQTPPGRVYDEAKRYAESMTITFFASSSRN